ncbi:MAG: TaqI-like C-terminal specificity domain-containing protein [Bacteroidota bacterium]
MNIGELNTFIEKLSSIRSRDAVFEFAFALIEWMGLQQVEDKKPRLLSPQTQKLKEYLVPVPLTVQPQLYRLTADGQNIRIRFATLKKPKKEYISQLVDNDPGLTSYQASIKGIVNLPGRPAYIPSEPYFIHFITTQDYDKLILVFNQGDQKRIITFRNKLTQTQYYRIVQQWKDIALRSKPELADLLWKSLDVKEVNKEFYRKIKERFDDLVGLLKYSDNQSEENHIGQFAIRLIGRYVFCWFLKEKGIIPAELISSFTIEQNRPDYYQNFLLRLFFQTLNTEVQQRNFLVPNHPLDALFLNIPYLDGGLFEDFAEDKPFHKFVEDDWLIAFVKILESYDFTVDESSMQYQQVAIDPEMLGRIFENLLASQNPETEKLANQRKAFGAFYTPREIVEYMVDASLKAHLEQALMPEDKPSSSQVNEPVITYSGTLFQALEPQQTEILLEPEGKYSESQTRKKIVEKIDKLFLPGCDTNPFDKRETSIVQNALRDIKVLDPACGSGAFPINMLLRLMNLREIIGSSLNSPYELKSEILSRNIYGVDIMPMAVEIARLRAWLSLVLEADYKPSDRKNNFGIAALPNLDFKFVCANSLIDVPEDSYVERMAANHISIFENLTMLYFNSSDNEKKELKTKINDCINVITEIHQNAIKSLELEIKKERKKNTEGKLKGMLENQNRYEQQHKLWQSYKNIFTNKTVGFFNTKYFFPSVKDGFDVVIGNPPYVNVSNLKPDDYRENLKSIFYSAKNKTDLYAFFIEAFTNRLKEYGGLVFIIPHTWKATDSFSKFREIIFKKNKVRSLVNLEMGVFEAIVKPLIIHLIRCVENDYTINILNENFQRVSSIDINEILKERSLSIDTTSNDFQKKLFQKIEKNSYSLENAIQFSRGIKTSDDKRFVGFEKLNDDYKPVFRGKNIKAYKLNWNNEFIWYRPDLMKEKVGSVSYSKEFFEVKEKIVTQRVNSSSQLLVAYDDKQNYFLDTVNVSRNDSWDKKTSLKYLLGLLNSRLINFWYCNKYKMPTIGLYELHTIPLESITIEQQKPFIDQVEKILSAKAQNQDTTALEKEIDVLVYKLYNLTYEEVKVIDKDFWLSEEEYEKIEMK